MNRIELVRNQGFPWHGSAGCHVRGFAFDPDDRLLEGERLASYFMEASDLDDFTSKVSDCNGMFSVVREGQAALWMACDRVRTFTLFYSLSDGDCLVSDSTDTLQEISGLKGRSALIDSHEQEFLSAGYVSGPDTLLKGISQVQASEVVCFERGKILRRFYYSYRSPANRMDPPSILIEEMDRMSADVFSRLIRSLNGRTAVVPLSGGYDSRFIAAMLKKMDYQKVICYSYGRTGNADMKGAEEVARRLGYHMVSIPYTGDLIHDFYHVPGFLDYVRYSANHTSMFFLQEYFAVKYLKEGGYVPEDAIFIPGHTGDFFAGGNFIKHGLPKGRERLKATAGRILRIKYALGNPDRPTRQLLMERIRMSLDDKMLNEPDVPGEEDQAMSHTVYEDWDLKERLPKFIINSASVYSFFGYSYRLPLFDHAFQDFFRDLPFSMKAGKYVYDRYLQNQVFATAGVNLEAEIQPEISAHRMTLRKEILKRWMPDAMLPSGPRLNDPIFYLEITDLLRQDLAKKGIRIGLKNRSFNSLIVQWYITCLRHGWI